MGADDEGVVVQHDSLGGSASKKRRWWIQRLGQGCGDVGAGKMSTGGADARLYGGPHDVIEKESGKSSEPA